MAEEWGPWIDHDGRGCPLAVGVAVIIRHENAAGKISTYPARVCRDVDHPDWDHRNFRRLVAWRGMEGVAGRVLAYRLRRPDALRRLVDMVEDPFKGLPPRFPMEALS